MAVLRHGSCNPGAEGAKTPTPTITASIRSGLGIPQRCDCQPKEKCPGLTPLGPRSPNVSTDLPCMAPSRTQPATLWSRTSALAEPSQMTDEIRPPGGRLRCAPCTVPIDAATCVLCRTNCPLAMADPYQAQGSPGETASTARGSQTPLSHRPCPTLWHLETFGSCPQPGIGGRGSGPTA
uniref:Uncharacterized protein n=1 Tax=Eutreptiella gymnastica TaxID=73025 RepID=A0A7S1JAX1_9EUGL|mmetsp:Transcript_79437/g.140187  ORF Transcript_79437/g.140187 Transcript_79437/m.140187 type:complete len:180 (+) Transcript_79437:161-700(+)